jgi:hypothetical protein
MPKILEKWEVLPHGELVELDQGILTVTGEIDMPIGHFPRRMTVIGLTGKRTAIFSAIALEETEMARIEALGRPAFLIVPSDSHRMDAKIWKQRYPDIEVLTPPGAADAVAEVVPVDATADVLKDPWVKFQLVPGTAEREAAVMVERPAGLTLICNDIIAHVAHPHGIGAQIMARLMGFGVAAPQVPRLIKSMLVEDARALAEQFRRWAERPELKRIVVSHGEVIDKDPRGVLNGLAATLA